MSIRVVTKETWTRIRGDEEMVFSNGKATFSNTPATWSYYVLDENIPFVVERYLEKVIVPKRVGDRMEEIINTIGTSELDLSEWLIDRVSEEADHVSYTKNEYKRTGRFWTQNNIKDHIKPGVYIIRSTKTGEEFNVSVWFDSGDWRDNNYICYPEKKRVPYDIIALTMKERFLEIIFKENGKNYREAIVKC